MNESTTLVATLGGQPQIITFTLDLLLERGEAVHQVIVVYPASNPRYRQAYQKLAGEFSGDRYRDLPCHLRSAPVQHGSEAIEEARTPQEIEAIRHTFYDLLSGLKAQGERLHLSLSGGRRIMALTALAAAMQHLTPADCVWHIYTPPELTEQARAGEIMHAPTDSGLRLISVPFVPWGTYFPGLRPLLESNPADLRGGWQDEAERERCQRTWQALTRRQRDVLRCLAEGLTRDQAAVELGVGITTIDSHRSAIFRKCADVWGNDANQRIDLHFLIIHFTPFLHNVD